MSDEQESQKTKSIMSFRLQGKKIFATYSQCNLTNEEVLTWWRANFEVHKYIVANEKHKSGDPHKHVYVDLLTGADIRNPRRCDIGEFHPNLEKVKNPYKVQKYCMKGDDYLTNMKFGTMRRANELAKVGQITQALMLVVEELPEETKNLTNIERGFRRIARLNGLKRRRKKKKFTADDFNAPEEVSGWNREEQALVLVGESGTGKTQFAKTLFENPLLVRHMDKLKQFDEWTHDGIIFDDMNFEHYPRSSCIHLVDIEEDADVNVKCSMVTIPAGTPRVFTTNLPVDQPKLVNDYNANGYHMGGTHGDTLFPTKNNTAIKRRLEVVLCNDLRRMRPQAPGGVLKKQKV